MIRIDALGVRPVAPLIGLILEEIVLSPDASIAPPWYRPQISIEPPEERKGREHINFLLMLGCLSVRRFDTAIALIRHCESLLGPGLNLDPPEWIGIAARDAAMSVYHFSVTLVAIRKGMKACPALQAQVDAAKLREARKAFVRDFPDAVLLRHAISHLAEQLSTPEKMAQLRRPGEFLIWESSVGSTFTMASPAGRQVRLDVHEQTRGQLLAVLVAVCEAFAGAAPTWVPAYS